MMRCPRVLSNLLLAASTVVVSLLLVEVGLRVVGVSYPAFYRVDSKRGYGLRPYARGLYSREGQSLVAINAAGFRGALPPLNSAGETLRIAVLGDSFTEGLQVEEQQTWIRILEAQLNRSSSCPLLKGGQAELLNFGVGGYGTGQALLTWRYQARAFQPALVILAIYPGNDFTDNQPGPREDRPGFELRADGALIQDNSFREAAAFRFRTSPAGQLLDGLMNHSRLLQVLNEAKNRFSAMRRQSQVMTPPSLSVAPAPTPEASSEAWAMTEALVNQLAMEVRAAGARLLVISTTTPDQVWPEEEERPAVPFRQEQQLAKLLTVAGIPYRSLGPEMQLAVDQNPKLLLHGFPDGEPGHGHWNATGHSLAALQLAPWLCEQ